jgi:lipopolysaccharide export system permease protein
MKNTINKYIFYEFLRYFFVSLFALAIIVWTVQSVNFLDLVTEDGHAFSTYFTYSVLTLSKVLTKLIPFCFLVALVLTIIKLEKDNEIIIIWTSGLNKIYIVNLFLRISLIIMLLQLILTAIINPAFLNISRDVIKNSQLDFIPSLLKQKQFNDTIEGLTIFVDKKNDKDIYSNIFIRDEGAILSDIGTDKGGSTSSTIFAKNGHMSSDEKSLILYNGNIQKLNNNGDVSVVKFKKTIFNLSGLSTTSISEPKIQETSTLKIFDCMVNKRKETHNCQQDKKSSMDIKIEFNKRFGKPIYIPLIALICSFLLSSRKDRKIYYYNKYIYFFISILILVTSEILVRYSGTTVLNGALYYSIPILLLPIFYITLIRKFKYENMF